MDRKKLKNLLNSTGLSRKEAKIYLYLLENGKAKAADIFKNSKLKKGNTYALLKKLIKKGLVLKKGTHFIPQPPKVIIQHLKKKIKSLKGSLVNFEFLMPQLNSMYKLSVGKPTIKYFEGQEGIREVFKDIYGPGKDIVYGCVDLERVDQVFPKYIASKLIPKRIKNKVKAVSLIGKSSQAKKLAEKDQEQLRETTLVDKEKYPFPAEIDVYQDKIAMLTFQKGEFIGLLLENKDLAETLKSLFRLAINNQA